MDLTVNPQPDPDAGIMAHFGAAPQQPLYGPVLSNLLDSLQKMKGVTPADTVANLAAGDTGQAPAAPAAPSVAAPTPSPSAPTFTATPQGDPSQPAIPAPPVYAPRSRIGDVLDSIFLDGAFRKTAEAEYGQKLANYNLARQSALFSQAARMIGDDGSSGAPQGAPAAAAQPSGAPVQGQPPAQPVGSVVASLTPPTPYMRQRKGLALMALAGGHPDQAATILQPDVKQGDDGQLYDAHTGLPTGTRLPNHTAVNGFNVDLGAPDAPGFIPNLPVGTMPDGHGGTINIPGLVAATQAQKEAEARGQTLGAIQHRPNPNGTESVGFGSDVYGQGAGAATKGAPGAPSGVGTTQSPGDAEFAKGQGKALDDTVNGLIDAREGALQVRQGALQTMAYARSHPMNAATPHLVAAANALRALPPGLLPPDVAANVDAAANDAGVFQRIANQQLLQAGKTLLPSRYTERELMLARPIAGSLSTPNEAMEYTAGLAGSLAKRTQDQADFAANYTGPKDRQSFQRAWANSPAGQRSIFQDPEIWKGVQIHGKPAVVYSNDGQWGAFALGTPQAYKFRVVQ